MEAMSTEHIANSINEVLPHSSDEEEVIDGNDPKIVEKWKEFIRSSSQSANNLLDDVKVPDITTPEVVLNNPLYKISKLYREDSEMILIPFAGGILLALLCTVLFKGSMILLLLAALVILFVILHRISKTE